MTNQEDKGTLDPHPDLPRMQSAAAEPVVNARNLPLMPEIAEIQPGQALMGRDAKSANIGKEQMAPVPRKRSAPQKKKRMPQEKPPMTSEAPSEGYIRLELHAENGQLSVVSIHEVAGPMLLPNAVARGYAYEALIDNRRIGLGSIPDAGVNRAFANRDVPGPEGTHRFFPETGFNFFVRIPKTELSLDTLPRLAVGLFQVEEAPEHLSLEPLPKHPGVHTNEIGRLDGIRLEVLPEALRTDIERILRVK